MVTSHMVTLHGNTLLARHWSSHVVPAARERVVVGGVGEASVGIGGIPSIAAVWEATVTKTSISQVLRLSLS